MKPANIRKSRCGGVCGVNGAKICPFAVVISESLNKFGCNLYSSNDPIKPDSRKRRR